MDLSCSVERRSDATIVHVVGDLDVAGSPTLRQVLIDVLSGTPATHLIVDLGDVAFLDTTGIGTLAGAYKRVTEKGGRFNLVVTTKGIYRVLELTGVLQVFRVKASVEEALND